MIECPTCHVSAATKDGKHFGVHFANLTDIRPCPFSLKPIPYELRPEILPAPEPRETITMTTPVTSPLPTNVSCATYTPTVYQTKDGTSYLKSSGVSIVSKPNFFPESMRRFIEGFGDTFDADEYVGDFYVHTSAKHSELTIDDGASLVKFAGQLCYLSFGNGRSKNSDAKKYLDNIKMCGHGSVLEHANYTLLVWGIDRSCTHEIVRHRAGFGFSQVSQRYVSGKTLRFVERPEFQADAVMHEHFEQYIDLAKKKYDTYAALLKSSGIGEGLSPTEARKACNQAARACLPNETEAPILITSNVRGWRHFIEQRGSTHADRPIRGLAMQVYRVLREVTPILFDDYVVETDAHGHEFLTTPHHKV